MQKTSNYQLNQWEAGDRVTREAINADNAAIDAALGTMPKIKFGSYVGTGGLGASNPNRINVGFAPKLVIVTSKEALSGSATLIMAYGQTYAAACGSNGGANYVSCTWSGTGVSWYCKDNQNGASYQLNYSGFTYFWFAIG